MTDFKFYEKQTREENFSTGTKMRDIFYLHYNIIKGEQRCNRINLDR